MYITPRAGLRLRKKISSVSSVVNNIVNKNNYKTWRNYEKRSCIKISFFRNYVKKFSEYFFCIFLNFLNNRYSLVKNIGIF
jgi:hypothetical protein